MFMRRGLCRLAVLIIAFIPPAQCPAKPRPPPSPTAQIAETFEHLRNDPLRLRAFLFEMPKGGDLHNHLDGAIYAENFLARAASTGLCIDTASLAIRRPPCNDHQPPADKAWPTTKA